MLSTLTLTLSPCSSPHPSDHLPSCHPFLFSSLPLLSCLTITCASTLPSVLWPTLFSLLCYFVFYPTFFHLLLLSPLCPFVSLSYSPSSHLFSTLLPLLSSLTFTLPLAFLFPSHSSAFAYGSGQCSPTILAQAGGRWVSPWLQTRTHRHMRMCAHTRTCWGWWLMSNARLSASMPIRAAQETSLGLLATAWHWLRYLPAFLLHSGKNLKSWGYILLNIDNHK